MTPCKTGQRQSSLFRAEMAAILSSELCRLSPQSKSGYMRHEVRVVTEEEEGFPAFFLVFTLHCLLGLARHGRPAGLARLSSLGGHSKLPVHIVSELKGKIRSHFTPHLG